VTYQRCEVCNKSISLVSNPEGACRECGTPRPGVFRAHGRRNNRCPGSGLTWWATKGLSIELLGAASDKETQ